MAKEPYHKEEKLRELYHVEGLSLPEIGEKYDIDASTVHYHMQKNGVERRKPANEWPLSIQHNSNGYVIVDCTVNGERKHLRLHRLLAVAEFGFDVVCDNDVHHKNGVPWDNRPENLKVLSRSEHLKHHNEKRPEKLEKWGREGAIASQKD